MMTLTKLGNNFHTLTFGQSQIWFSYETPIAFYTPAAGFFIRENNFGTTTGKHLNAVDPNKSKRLDSDTFERKLEVFFNV